MKFEEIYMPTTLNQFENIIVELKFNVNSHFLGKQLFWEDFY
jgi:hypothetical protein